MKEISFEKTNIEQFHKEIQTFRQKLLVAEDCIKELKECVIIKDRENKEIVLAWNSYREKITKEMEEKDIIIITQENELKIMVQDNERQKQILRNAFGI